MSVQVLYAVGNDTQDVIISIAQMLHFQPNLQYADLSLDRVSDGITQQLNQHSARLYAMKVRTNSQTTYYESQIKESDLYAMKVRLNSLTICYESQIK